MKKKRLILIVAFLVVLLTPSYAQIQVGPIAGVNLSGLSINPDVQGRNINTKTGFTAGAIIIYNFSQMFSVQLEPTYTQKGASVYSAQTDEGLILEIEQNVDMTYIDVPVLFRVTFDGDFAKPYLMAGANFGFPLGNTKLKIESVKANGENVIELLPSDLIEQELKNEIVDYGLNFGAGITFPIGVFGLFFQAQYNLGLSDLNDEVPPEGIEKDVIKNKGFQIKTGFLISF